MKLLLVHGISRSVTSTHPAIGEFSPRLCIQREDGSLGNVIDSDQDVFSDGAATALLAAVTYRMAAFTDDTDLIPKANKAYDYVQDNLDESGWVISAVDPYTFTTQLTSGQHSPEAQAFVLMLEAARRDFVDYVETNDTDSSTEPLQRRQTCLLRK